ncbi:adenylyltransferase/cytidyltransferase family protein [bacterium]|nr:adenylyltransferase/cytidyltransferase family protein [bacterium]
MAPSLTSPKILSIAAVARKVQNLRSNGMLIVTTNGTFDLLHPGHVHSLIEAKKHGDVLIVGVNSDASVRRYKGKLRPIVPAKERAFMVSALECVDYVFIFSSDTPDPWIKKVRPDIHVKGSDRSLAEITEGAIVASYGGKVKLIRHTGRHSTTRQIERIVSAYRDKKPESK